MTARTALSVLLAAGIASAVRAVEFPRADFTSFSTVKEAMAIRPESSSRRICLDSERAWRFKWSLAPLWRPVGFQFPTYDVSDWDVVKVPCSWSEVGVGAPEGDADPICCCRRDFTIPEDWENDEVYLEFGAVGSAFRLWMNGSPVDRPEGGRGPLRFNVTKFAHAGVNTVALEIGRPTGVMRGVWAFHVPKVHVQEVRLSTVPVVKGRYDGDWRVDLQMKIAGGWPSLKVHVFDDRGTEIPHVGLVFHSPKLWSAECPNLYTLVVELLDGERTLEAVGFQLGFREFSIRETGDSRGRALYVNGRPVELRGAVRGSSTVGCCCLADAQIEQDVRRLKYANCNYVCDFQGSEPGYFLYLCNKFGLYAFDGDEANVGGSVPARTLAFGHEAIRHAFRPIVAAKGADGRSIEVTNRHDIRDLSAYQCVLTHLVDGRPVESNPLEVAANAHETARVPIADPTGSYRLEFHLKQAEGMWPKGWTIAADQIDFTEPTRPVGRASGKLSFVFSRETGELTSIRSGRFLGTELLETPMTLGGYCGKDRPVPVPVSFSDRMTDDGVRVVRSRVDYMCSSGRIVRTDTVWRIADGAADVKTKFLRPMKSASLPRMGWQLKVDSTSLNVDWLGCGPFSNGPGSRSGAFLGWWSLPAADFIAPSDVSPDGGNREGTYAVQLSGHLAGLTVETLDRPFSFKVGPSQDGTHFGLYTPIGGQAETSSEMHFRIR